MSTSGDSDAHDAMDKPVLPPEWEERPEAEPICATAWVPPERHGWIRVAVGEVTAEVEFVGSLREAADSNLVILSDELLPGEPELREYLLARSAAPEPILVIIDALPEARVRYQRDGADIAVGQETPARELGARIRALVRRARVERDRNTLTGLPGNRALRRRLVKMLEDGQTVALVMADIDEFKAFNDSHGHLSGDALICTLAGALREATRPREAFLAHVGGDDFAVVCDPDQAGEIARAAEAEFARRRDDVAAGVRPQVTIVSTTIEPAEAATLEAAFRRLARLRREARGG